MSRQHRDETDMEVVRATARTHADVRLVVSGHDFAFAGTGVMLRKVHSQMRGCYGCQGTRGPWEVLAEISANLSFFERMLRWTDDAVDKKTGVENTSKRFDHVSGWARSRNHSQFGRQNNGIVKS